MTDDRSKLRKEWKKEISAGGLVFKKEHDKYHVLVIMPKKNDPRDETFTPVWTFPKGWVGDHGNETLGESALREVREEGGVAARILQKLDEVQYFFHWQGDRISKTVHWYLMEYESGDPADHDNETDGAKWFEAEKALEILTYKTDREVYQKALQALKI